MYADFDKVDHRTRVLNYVKAMEQLAAKYPNDDEAQIHYALALNVGASPTDKTYANQLEGAAILEKIWERQPDHPGIAHYLVHLYDTPALAEKGLTAARHYAKIAPDAPHALDMPPHIFTRVGYWQESIDSNAASARSAKADKETSGQLLAMDYEVYAYLQLAQDARAKAVIDEMVGVNQAGPFALAASPARCAVERDAWKEAAALEVRPNPLPHIPAITWFAKALGAARSGDTAQADVAIARLVALRDELRENKDAYWSQQVDIQAQVATAWLLFATGHKDEALTKLSAAAEALVAFKATLRKEPNRLNAILGAAAAADDAGDKAKAGQYFRYFGAATKARAFLTSGRSTLASEACWPPPRLCAAAGCASQIAVIGLLGEWT